MVKADILPISPLRYPGAKRWLVNYLVNVLEYNKLRPELFIEPFAGGASISLALLHLDKVNRIGLADLDPMLTAFWQTVFFDSGWLIDRIETCDITLDEWLYLKNSKFLDRRELAYKCLFLNRTSFSGILHHQAGPIGGMKQQSMYKIDCRFSKDTVIQRIQNVSKFRDRIEFIWNWTWKRTISELEKKQKFSRPGAFFYYVDPPFYKKADRLYSFYFKEDRQHRELRDTLLALKNYWLLSYDCHHDIKLLYSKCNNSYVDIAYTTNGLGNRNTVKELIASNVRLPPEKVAPYSEIGNVK